MARHVEEIDARIAKVERLRETEDLREIRLLETTAKLYREQEEIGLSPMEAIFKGGGIEARAVEQFFEAQEEEARQRHELATRELQLTSEELAFFEAEERAIRLIDPCAWVHSSPGWICVWHAASCGKADSTTGQGSTSCTCDVTNNECNPKAQAPGYGTKGKSQAYLHSWCYFDIPARVNPATVHVDALVYVHGFYINRPSAGSATVSLELEMKGYQYGWSWATATSSVVNLSGDSMGRFDGARTLQFQMPVGADPFLVRVSAKLRAYGKRGGALGVVDFGTGAGNYIKTVYVNTHSPTP